RPEPPAAGCSGGRLGAGAGETGRVAAGETGAGCGAVVVAGRDVVVVRRGDSPAALPCARSSSGKTCHNFFGGCPGRSAAAAAPTGRPAVATSVTKMTIRTTRRRSARLAEDVAMPT